jgi:hypothetical protein
MKIVPPIKEPIYTGGIISRVWVRFFSNLAKTAETADDNDVSQAMQAEPTNYDSRLQDLSLPTQFIVQPRDHTREMEDGRLLTILGIGGSQTSQDISTTASPIFATVRLTNLTDGYIPYHVSDAVGLEDSVISEDAAGIHVGSETTGKNLNVEATLGPEQMPAISGSSGDVGGWTFSTGFTEYTNPIAGGIIDKKSDGSHYITTTDVTTITASACYKIQITTVNSPTTGTVAGTFQITLGAQSGMDTYTPVNGTTFTKYVTTTTTSKIVITPSNTSRFGLSLVSVKLVSSGIATVTNGLTVSGGQLLIPEGTVSNPGLAFADETGTGFRRLRSGYVAMLVGGVSPFFYTSSGFVIASGKYCSFSEDTSLIREAAGILSLRQGTGSMQFNIFNTYTGSTNLENAQLGWKTTANVFTIATEAGSAVGTHRNMNLVAPAIGVGVTSATAVLHLKAGTAVANTGPLKFTLPAALLTAPEVGVLEPFADDLYYTISTGVARKSVVFTDGFPLTFGRVSYSTTDGRQTDDACLTCVPPALVLKGTTATNTASYGAEQLSSAGWTVTAGWTEAPDDVFTHAAGTTTLSHSVVIDDDRRYQVTWTVTGYVSGHFDIHFGGIEIDGETSSGDYGPTTVGTDAFTVIPSNDFVGTVVLSLKKILAKSDPVLIFKSSEGTTRVEMRTPNGGNSTFVGDGTGGFLTTGNGNHGFGKESLNNITSGTASNGFGSYAVYGNTTGMQNNGFGFAALYHNVTGSFNVAVGGYALEENVDGSGNVAIGFEAGHWETGSNTLFIDNNARTNEADGRVKALVYGIFNAATASQYLTVNGHLNALESIDITTVGTTTANALTFGADTNLYRSAANMLKTDDGLTVTGAFGCNGTAAQTAYPCAAWDEPGAGIFGVDSAAHMAALVELVKDIQAALIANGSMAVV